MMSKHPMQAASTFGRTGAPAQVGALLMADGGAQRSGPPYMFSGLSEAEIAHVLGSGKRRVLYRGAQLFSQGSPQDGIFLIESGRIKVFYTAPSGREITLAYWHSGNFVGGPEVFRQGLHVWSGEANVHGPLFFGSSNDLVERFSYGADPKRVLIRIFTHSQIWDASSVAALDLIETNTAITAPPSLSPGSTSAVPLFTSG